jgi:polyhydroxyalkanoate synthesis regulator phasin
MTDAWQAYIDLALGFTETSRKRATKVVKQMVGKGNATADQLQSMAEDLVNTGLHNREAVVRLVRFELDRALGRVGLATAEEVGDLTGRVRELEEKLRAAESALAEQPPAPAAAGEPAAPVPPAVSTPAAPAPTVAKKTVAKKAPAPAPAAAKAAPAKAATPPKAAPSKAAPAKATTTASTPVVAKKTVAKKTVAKKTTGGTK